MSYLLPTYKRLPIAFSHGEGMVLFDSSGKRYLDFLSGIAVCALGHAHPRLVAAISDQAKKLWHVSNLFEIPEQEALAQALIARSGLSRAFFGNSGAEGNEALIKLSRLWGKARRNGACEVITLVGSFHGRTMATLSATGQDKVKIGFDPLVPGFVHVPAGDFEAIEKAVSNQTAAILIEVVQGEGGLKFFSGEYLRKIRALCDANDLLLLIDEVQTGIGRTGTWFGFQGVPDFPDLRPDAISLAKGLAGGLPMGACLVGEKVAPLFAPGTHASTFGGNPLVSRVALELIHVIEDEGLLPNAVKMGARLIEGLKRLQKNFSFIKDVRGRGLMIGCELTADIDTSSLVQIGLDEGIVLNVVQNSIIRLVPPLIIGEDHVDEGLEKLGRVLERISCAS